MRHKSPSEIIAEEANVMARELLSDDTSLAVLAQLSAADLEMLQQEWSPFQARPSLMLNEADPLVHRLMTSHLVETQRRFGDILLDATQEALAVPGVLTDILDEALGSA